MEVRQLKNNARPNRIPSVTRLVMDQGPLQIQRHSLNCSGLEVKKRIKVGSIPRKRLGSSGSCLERYAGTTLASQRGIAKPWVCANRVYYLPQVARLDNRVVTSDSRTKSTDNVVMDPCGSKMWVRR